MKFYIILVIVVCALCNTVIYTAEQSNSIDMQALTLCYKAIEADDVSVLGELLAQHPWLAKSQSVSTYKTPLEIAIEQHKIEAVNLLLKNGAAVNIQSGQYSFCPLHLSIVHQSHTIFHFLLAHGADVNAVAGDGKTALHQALLWDFNWAIKPLLEKGADISIQDIYSAKPLDLVQSNKEIEQLLLLYGAQKNPDYILCNEQQPEEICSN